MNANKLDDLDHPTTIEPILSVRNGKRAVEFYKLAFGAEEVYRHEAENGEVVAQLQLDKARFWVADESPENANFSPEFLDGGSVRMLLVVDDPDIVFNRAVETGAEVVWPVESGHGWRVGRLVDPFGHHWEIGKPLADEG